MKSKKLKRKAVRIVKSDRLLAVPSIKIAKKLALELGLIASLVAMTSCGNFYAQMGTAEAIRAHNDLITGAISQAKTPDGQESDHMQLRKIQASKLSVSDKILNVLFPSKQGAK